MRRGRLGNFRVSGSELLGICACLLAFSLWNFAARSKVDPAAVWFFASFCYACVVSGRLCWNCVFPRSNQASFPTVFLFGFFLVSQILFLSSMLSPLGMVRDGLVIALGTLVWGLLQKPSADVLTRNKSDISLGLIATLLSLVGGTLWLIDSIVPSEVAHGDVTFKPWVDRRARCMIRMFRDSHGIASLNTSCFRGNPPRSTTTRVR